MFRLIVGVVVAAAGVFVAAQDRGAEPTDVVTLAVPGRSNATASIAAAGSRVAVAWGATVEGKTDVFVAVSKDGARTFAAPRQVNTATGEARLGGEMPPRVEWRVQGVRSPELVVLWTARGATTDIKLSRSRDDGQTFTAPATLQTHGAPGDRGWPALAVDRSGIAHAIWLDHRGLAAREGAAPQSGHKEHDGAAMAQRSGLFYSAMRQGGAQEQRITNGVCYCCKTALVSGSAGELYAAWRHVYAGNIRDIAFSVSRDGGPFTPPVRVSEDEWELNGCPDDGPAMAVDRSGMVHLVWPTVITEPEPQGALFYSATRDGKSFTTRLRIPTQGSPKPSHPQIAVTANQEVLIAWDEVLDGTRRAFVRQAAVRGRDLMLAPPEALDAGGSSMYPVLATGDEGTVVAWTAGPQTGSTIRVRRLGAKAVSPLRSVQW